LIFTTTEHCLAASDSIEDTENRGWVDSGCSILATGEKNELSDIRQGAEVNLEVANGNFMTSTCIGNIGPFKAVYFEELAGQTLISVSQLARLGYDSIFTHESIRVVERVTGLTVIVGELRDRLYSIKLSQLRNLEKALLGRETDLIHGNNPALTVRNHNRCSHVGNRMLENALRNDLCDGLSSNLSDFKVALPKCVICGQAKAKRRPLRRLMVQYKSKLIVGSKLQVDIQGPMQVEAVNGERYCTLGLDYHSDKTFIAFHKTKDESAQIVENWITGEYKANKHELSIIKCDNDPVYLSTHFTQRCHAQGIRFQKSQAYNPEQNSRIEKRFEYIDGLARANLYNYQVIWELKQPPIKLFPYAMAYAIYVSDRLRPSYLDKSISAHEAFTGERPDLRTSIPFGTLGICCMTDIKPKSSMKKMDDRGFPAIFIGFDPTHSPGYLMMTKSHPPRIFVCRNVTFDLVKNDLALEKYESHHELFSVNHITSASFKNISNQYVNTDPNVGSEDSSSKNSDDEEDEPAEELPKKRVRRTNKEINHEIDYRDKFNFRSANNNAMKRMENLLEQKDSNKLFLLSDIYTPMSLKQALSCSDAEFWRRGIIKEIQSQFDKGTHKRVVLPRGATAIQSKWIFRVKANRDGSLQYKARLVAQGQTQIYGIDFDETYSPVARLETTRVFFARAAQYEWIIHQMDVDTAYLNATLDHTIYMRPPQGFRADEEVLCPPDYICKKGEVLQLMKAIYGTKQAGLQWFKLLRQFILSIGYVQCKFDGCLFTRNDDEHGHNEILVYVDDLLIAGESLERTQIVKQQFKDRFEMKDLGLCERFLGINVKQDFDNHRITLSAREYTESIIKEFDMEDNDIYPEAKFPYSPECVLTKGMCPTPEEAIKQEYIDLKVMYRKLVGKLSYLADKVRADILTAVGMVNAYTTNPGWDHWCCAIHIVQYLKYFD
jgi:hypothetical protein